MPEPKYLINICDVCHGPQIGKHEHYTDEED